MRFLKDTLSRSKLGLSLLDPNVLTNPGTTIMIVDTNTDTAADVAKDASVITGAVLYTDGSCRGPNPGPGFIGWGTHGYIFNIKDGAKPINVDNHVVTNEGYVHNSFAKHHPNAKPVEVVRYLDFFGSSLIVGTNNEAELQAFVHSLERVSELGLNIINYYTDSKYLRDGITDWCKKWEYHGWRKQDGTSVSNYEWWMRAFDLYKKLMAQGIAISINWVKGHNDIMGNVQADILAGTGTNYSIGRQLRNEFKMSDARGYWNQEIEKHPFLSFKRIYFNSVDQYNVPGHYFQADTAGADLLIGKRIPETGLSVVKLKTPDAIIEGVKQFQYKIAKETNAIIMMKLDRVFSKGIYPYLADNGGYSLLPGKGNLNINFFDKQPVTVEVNPTGLSMRAIESFNLLEELLDRFLQCRENGFNLVDNNIQLNAHDITDTFYTKEEKVVKKDSQTQLSLKPEFVVGFRDMSIDIEEPYGDSNVSLKVPLILGTDMPPRNSLKKLESHKPTVYLLTWREAAATLRYATVIECETGIGIWSNFFADKIFFPKTST